MNEFIEENDLQENPVQNTKIRLRLLAAVKKAREDLSIDSEAFITVDYIAGEYGLDEEEVTEDQFEEIIEPII